MALQYDLHVHSTASDGTLSPESLVRRAHAQDVDVLALTDHDATSGLDIAARTAHDLGLSFVPGIEISVTWRRQTLHIVGLCIDPQNAALATGLEQLVAFRNWRAGEISRRLEKKGIPGAYEGARALAHGKIISRTHFARYLAEAGYGKDVREVFKHFLVHNRPGYVPGEWATLEQTLSWIQASGGVAVIAHPRRYRFSATRLRRLLGEFSELGGEGIEVISANQAPADSLDLSRQANQFNLYASCGSDFHDPQQRFTELGRLPPLPEGARPIWECERWSVNQTKLSQAV